MFAVWEGKGIPTFTYTGSYQILNVVIMLYLILLHIQKIEKLDFYELCYYLENLNKISKAYDNILKVENRELKEKNNG